LFQARGYRFEYPRYQQGDAQERQKYDLIQDDVAKPYHQHRPGIDTEDSGLGSKIVAVIAQELDGIEIECRSLAAVGCPGFTPAVWFGLAQAFDDAVEALPFDSAYKP
jgi:hypothetical protein